jgi:hypothetical protein
MTNGSYYKAVIVFYFCGLCVPFLLIAIAWKSLSLLHHKKKSHSSRQLIQSQSQDDTTDVHADISQHSPFSLTRYITPLFFFNLTISVVCCWALLRDIQDNHGIQFADGLFYYTNAHCRPYEVCRCCSHVISVYCQRRCNCDYMLLLRCFYFSTLNA